MVRRPSNLKASAFQRLRFSLVLERVESDPVLLSPSGTAIAIERPSKERWPGLHGSIPGGESQGFVFFSHPAGCLGGGCPSSSAPIDKKDGRCRQMSEAHRWHFVTYGQAYAWVLSASGQSGHPDGPTSPIIYALAKHL